MIQIRSFDSQGNPQSPLSTAVDSTVESPSLQLLHDACVMYHANRRVGTAKTKSRGEVSGSTRKLYKQKGTGNARAGQKRTPTRRGGGHCFAKVPKDWSYQIPRKARQAALRVAVKLKLQAGEISSAQLPLQLLKTKAIASFLRTAVPDATSCLLVTKDTRVDLVRVTRNIPSVTVCQCNNLNADLVMRHRQIIVDAQAFDLLIGSAV